MEDYGPTKKDVPGYNIVKWPKMVSHGEEPFKLLLLKICHIS